MKVGEKRKRSQEKKRRGGKLRAKARVGGHRDYCYQVWIEEVRTFWKQKPRRRGVRGSEAIESSEPRQH